MVAADRLLLKRIAEALEGIQQLLALALTPEQEPEPEAAPTGCPHPQELRRDLGGEFHCLACRQTIPELRPLP